jgi:hypothetical protein
VGVQSQKWKKFHKWFQKNKSEKFVNHVIAPVHQRAGLGCPPEKFTTNRSERTNGVIQDYVKRKHGHRLVDVFTTSCGGQRGIHSTSCLRKAESSSQSMGTDVVQPAADGFEHSCSVEDVSRTDVSTDSTITAAVSEVSNPILKAILDAGVDWIPRDSLALTADKADKAAKLGNDGATVALPSVCTIYTFIVPSKSDPKKPHIVNIHPNGKCECDNCHMYKYPLYAHM